MDALRCAELKAQISEEATAEQCLELEELVRKISAEKQGEMVAARRSRALDEARKYPHCGRLDVVKHGIDGRSTQRFRCRQSPGGGCWPRPSTCSPGHLSQGCANRRNGQDAEQQSETLSRHGSARHIRFRSVQGTRDRARQSLPICRPEGRTQGLRKARPRRGRRFRPSRKRPHQAASISTTPI